MSSNGTLSADEETDRVSRCKVASANAFWISLRLPKNEYIGGRYALNGYLLVKAALFLREFFYV